MGSNEFKRVKGGRGRAQGIIGGHWGDPIESSGSAQAGRWTASKEVLADLKITIPVKIFPRDLPVIIDADVFFIASDKMASGWLLITFNEKILK